MYFEDLAPVLTQVAQVLASLGQLAFSVETHKGDRVILRETLRYAHARDVADRESHPQHKEDVHGQVGDGKVDLQAGSSDGCDALRRPARPATSY